MASPNLHVSGRLFCELMVNDPLRIERLEARIIELEEEVAGLRERLGEADPGPSWNGPHRSNPNR